VTIHEALETAFPKRVTYVEGAKSAGNDRSGFADAVAAANKADVVVAVLGEGWYMSGEAASRAYPELPGQQGALAEAVFEKTCALGIPLIVILLTGRPLIVPWLDEKADALIAAWFLGSEAGNAIADVLIGRASPSGRTAITWPRALGQVPIFFGERPSGRPANPDDYFTSKFLDVPNEPLYPFGHGLTYGRCTYANLRAEPANVTESDTIVVRVDVTNSGARAADETVFLFTRDPVASVARPLLELKGFARVVVPAEGMRTVELALAAAELRFLGPDLVSMFEPGTIEILVGPCADRAQLLSTHVRLRA